MCLIDVENFFSEVEEDYEALRFKGLEDMNHKEKHLIHNGVEANVYVLVHKNIEVYENFKENIKINEVVT